MPRRGALTALTITVIALSIHAVLRSEDMGLSVNKGYIGADALWKQTVPPPAAATTSSLNNKVADHQPATGAAAKPKLIVSRRRGLAPKFAGDDETDLSTAATTEQEVYAVASSRPLPKECFLGCSGGDGDEPTQVTFNKADRTNLRVVLVASNPGGRTKIDCNGTRVSLVDMEPPHGEIGSVTLGDFTVRPQTTVTLLKRFNSTDTGYIWKHYHLAHRFSVQVRVTSSVTSYPLGKRGKTVRRNYTCQPVTVGLIDEEDIYATDHACSVYSRYS